MTGTVRARDPNTGTMVPVLGAGMTRAAADAKYVMVSGDTMTGDLIARDPTYTAPGAEDSTVVSRDYVDGTNVGMICPFMGNYTPAGWIWCNGDSISRSTYWRLFNVIGTNYGGGDGSSTFGLPNMLGRIWVGCGSSGYFDGMGEYQGTQTVTLDGNMVPYEAGQWEMHDAGARTMIYFVGGSITVQSNPGAYRTGYPNSGTSSIGGVNMDLGFSQGAHNNIMWSMTVHYMIKY